MMKGPRKSDYRRFNIEGITPGDDYAALEQALLRRYRRVQTGECRCRICCFIDGGKGQLSAVAGVLDELGIDGVKLVGVSKGPDRKAGAEQLWLAMNGPMGWLEGQGRLAHVWTERGDCPSTSGPDHRRCRFTGLASGAADPR